MKKKVVYFHGEDLDGIGSAAILYNQLSEEEKTSAKFIGVKHGDTWKQEDVEGAEVYVLDFGFKDMDELRTYTRKLVWIDHHITSKQAFPILWHCFASIPGRREIDTAAIQLTWNYFHPDEETPEVVKLIADRDIWKFEYSKTKDFTIGLNLEITKYNDDRWSTLFSKCVSVNSFINNITNDGRLLNVAKQKRVEQNFMDGQDVMFEGHKTRLINTNHDISDTGSFGYKEKGYPVILTWSVRGDKVICSLRSNTVDVSELAVRYKGGGHRFASGFSRNMDFIEWIMKQKI